MGSLVDLNSPLKGIARHDRLPHCTVTLASHPERGHPDPKWIMRVNTMSCSVFDSFLGITRLCNAMSSKKTNVEHNDILCV